MLDRPTQIRALVLIALIILLAAFVLIACGETQTLAPASAKDSAITYIYDSAGRLIQVDYGDSVRITYTYDKAGNLLSQAIVRK
jgi:YD repeat-containing protein